MAREILEAVYGDNNDSTLIATCLVAAAAESPQGSVFHSSMFCAYVYVSVSDSSEDPTLYISLGLLRHILYTRLNLIAHRYHDSKLSMPSSHFTQVTAFFP